MYWNLIFFYSLGSNSNTDTRTHRMKNLQVGDERQFSGYKNMLLLQKTGARVPVPTSSSSWPPITPNPENLMPLSSCLEHTCIHILIPLHKRTRIGSFLINILKLDNSVGDSSCVYVTIESSIIFISMSFLLLRSFCNTKYYSVYHNLESLDLWYDSKHRSKSDPALALNY